MRIRTCLLLALTASLCLAAIAVWWAPLNQDEGWYLMAARRVGQGQMPYRDFAFTQGPVFPYVFQFARPLIRETGLLGGRLLNLLFAGVTLVVLIRGLRLGVPKSRQSFAILLLICLLGLNSYQAQYMVTVKTYALAGFLLSLGVLGWLRYLQSKQLKTLCLCALALAAATATRLSLGLFFLPLGLSLLLNRKSDGDSPWIAFGGAGLLGLTLFFGPFLLQAPEGLKFGLLDFHAAREADSVWLLKAGFLSRVVQSYLPALLIFPLLFLRWKQWRPGLRSVALGILSVTVLHLLAPFPYDDYQAALFPALALLIAIEGSSQFPEAYQHRAAPWILAAGLLFAFSSAQLTEWFSHGQDRIWWNTKSKSDLQLLRETAEKVREITPENGLLFTTETYLAIESGLEIPADMEMGAFAYFPNLDTSIAEARHVLNDERLLNLIRNTQAPTAALSGYSFAIESPWITPTPDEKRNTFVRALQQNYRPVRYVENFGQGPTTLWILERRHPDAIPSNPLPR